MTEYPQIGVRMDEEFLKRIDEWRRKQVDLPGRPEAIRRLVEMGLSSDKAPHKRAKGKRARPRLTLDGVEIGAKEAMALLREDLGLRPDGSIDPDRSERGLRKK